TAPFPMPDLGLLQPARARPILFTPHPANDSAATTRPLAGEPADEVASHFAAAAETAISVRQRTQPPGNPSVSPPGIPPIRARDRFWLGLALLVIIGTGLGVRDLWPADEPRFAAIARDMVSSGEWLFPRVGGDLYQDKPPLFFWMLAVC